MSTVVYVLEVVVALGLIILVHELGHFLTAKRFGVRVYRFALGMGPILAKWQRGETEYSLRWIPVGGFVDLAGEHPSSEDGADPRGLCNKPAWQRVVVFSAGVVMNAVLAVVLFTVAPLVGIRVQTTEMGEPVPGMPAALAGIREGDRIVAVNGEPVESFGEINLAILSEDKGAAFTLTVERPVAGAAPERLDLPEMRSVSPGGATPMLGVTSAADTTLAIVMEGSLEAQAGLKVDDRIVAVNGTAVDRWNAMTRLLKEAPAGPVTLRVERDGREQDLAIDPAKLKTFQWGMDPPTLVRAVEAGAPAAGAGVKAGDRIARLAVTPAADAAPLPDGQAPRGGDLSWPAHEQLSETIRAAGAGATVRLTLLRGDEYVDATCRTTVLKGEDRPRIGVATTPAVADPVQIGRVEPHGAAAKADLQPGDVVLAAGKGGEAPASWGALLTLAAGADEPMPLKVRRGQSVLSVAYRPDAEPPERFVMDQSEGQPVVVSLPRISNPLTAATRGLKRAYRITGVAYTSIRMLVTRKVGLDNVAGPVGIVSMSVEVASFGFGTLIDFWGVLSVFVAVMNFLPIPPFDGGHVLFVLIDRIKGTPVSLRVRHAFWLVGWAAVGLLFLFVTYQDVLRLVLRFKP